MASPTPSHTLTPQPAAPPLEVARLQSELARLVKALHDDLRQRCDERAEVNAPLLAEYEEARRAERTSEAFGPWREGYLNQVAVAWVLASLFLRYLEDNGLVDEVWLSGPGPRRVQAEERYSAYFRQHPEHSDREYFHHAFEQLSQLPGCGDLFGRQRTPLWKVGLSGDGARRLRAFWWDIDPNRGAWSLEGADTRFLGDLYQNLSEEARSRYALLQTPDFVESFILDRTLEPAVREFGLEQVRIIDPTCGSGHFLLGAFERLLQHWRNSSSDNPRVLARKALEAVHGIDINPFAVAIARFRLLLAFLRACGFSRLKDMPDVHPRVATGDSLLFARRVDRQNNASLLDWLPEPFATGDYDEACQILSQRYHAVVGNPPYITDKDKRHNEVVRSRYYSCHMKYSLGVPFTERFFDLAVGGQRAGYIGMITTNSFMKREFGKKLIEDVLPRLDLTHVLDTSGAYIPGHGTPTVILLGRNRGPVATHVRAVLGIRGEPSTPEVPAQGLVWSSIVQRVDGKHGDQNAYVSVADVERATFSKHPWSIGGGGAAELKERIEEGCKRLGERVETIGVSAVLGEDDCFLPGGTQLLAAQLGVNSKPLVLGDNLRDYTLSPGSRVIYPSEHLESAELHYFWPHRTSLSARVYFSKTMSERGLRYFDFSFLDKKKLRTPLSIAFAEVATHNHFVLDRGGKVFKQTAPIIKLPEGASEDDHLALLGLLNSSTWCFWAQQTCYNKGGPGGGSSKDEKWHDFYQFDGTKLQLTPLPGQLEELLPLARELDRLAMERQEQWRNVATPTAEKLATMKTDDENAYLKMVALQEELDWKVLHLYGLCQSEMLADDPLAVPSIAPGERAFEILAARQMEMGELATRWFERAERRFTNAPPSQWPLGYRTLVERRVSALTESPELRLVESFGCKRRWEYEPWEERQQRALRQWLLDRMEQRVQQHEQLLSTGRLADELGQDAEFLAVLALYRGRDDLHLVSEVTELVTPEGVPFLAAWRYTDTGLRVRAEWERCWELQRRQDAGEQLDIPVPPKYASKDFRKSTYWSLRGKLDVPKERFILYPGAEREADPSPVLGWAGWNHLQRAQALATYLLERKDSDGWDGERLQPLLAGLAELLPWLQQWHNDIDPDSGERLGDYFDTFLRQEARAHGLTLAALRAWRPPASKGSGGRGKTSRL